METDNTFEIRLPASTQIVRVRLIPSSRARRMTIRIKANGSVCITMPAAKRGDVREKARLFALKNLDWIDRQLEKIARDTSGQTTETLETYLKNKPQIFAGTNAFRVELSTTFARPFYIFRPQESVVPIYIREASAETDLKSALTGIAKETLPEIVRDLAAQCGVSVEKISVRDQQSRWGSCTTRGDISLNWRLILLPPEIQRHIILHELAHRRHMNHSDDFWDLLCSWDPQAVKHDAELRRKWIALFHSR